MVIRGHELDLVGAFAVMGLPDGSVRAVTREELNIRLASLDAAAFPTGYDPTGEARGLLADVYACLDWLFDLCSVAMGHGIKRDRRLDNSGVDAASYVGPALAPRQRFFADTLQMTFSSVTPEPIQLMMHAPLLFRALASSANRRVGLDGRDPEGALSEFVSFLASTPLGGVLARDEDAWAPKMPSLVLPIGSLNAAAVAPCQSLAQVAAFADMQGMF